MSVLISMVAFAIYVLYTYSQKEERVIYLGIVVLNILAFIAYMQGDPNAARLSMAYLLVIVAVHYLMPYVVKVMHPIKQHEGGKGWR